MDKQQVSHGPLAGITVVDVSSAVAGPWVSSWLAELGAEVIFIEKVGVPNSTNDWRGFDSVGCCSHDPRLSENAATLWII